MHYPRIVRENLHSGSECLYYRPDLAKPASTLYTHNLSGVLEAAIRATNAQFEDPDIIKRLDCRLLEVLWMFTLIQI